MSRRKLHEVEFGSDSFLDVLANMVGILIILIVIACVRAGRTPVLPPLEGPELVETAEPIASITEQVDAEPVIGPEPIVEVPELGPEDLEPPRELVLQLKSVETEITGLRSRHFATEEELKKLREQAEAARQEADAAEKAASDEKRDLEEHKIRVARLQQSLGDRKDILTGLLADFEDAKNARAPVVKVKHRLAPISQEIQGPEVHFRLLGNRVSVVPLDELVERLKFQLERQKDWLARHSRHQAVVGPVGGYSLQYVVERQQLSPMEERKLGYGAFRVGVASWELVPERDVPTESVEEALRRGSRFAIALQAAPENATLTFWVYPDSFGLYRKLQEASHAEGFVVAARPLPKGVAIAGSPNGTRSAGQ